MTDLSHSYADHDVATLQTRVTRRRRYHTRTLGLSTVFTTPIDGQFRRLSASARAIPARYALHMLVALLVPLAAIVGQMPLAPYQAPALVAPSIGSTADFVAPAAPLALDAEDWSEIPAPDSAFAAIDSLPVSTLPPALLAPITIATTVAVESASARNGPGTNYDKVAALTSGTPLQLLARFEGWYWAKTDDGRTVWIAAELLNLDVTIADLLPIANDIPAPPPAKVGSVVEQGLNLRDGPGTGYVGLTKLNAGLQLDLLARYGDWFQVQTAEGQVGWVLGQFLGIQPGVVERVEAVTSIPDPNPQLVALVRERSVNLRGGPGAAYEKLATLGSDTRLDLLGSYQDWFKVRTSGGKIGWVSNELVDVSAFVARRVPRVRDIPALPRPAARPVASSGAAVALPAPAATAGGVVGFATQFVGSRYVWGGATPKGFDCSGFTMYVYQQYGLNLPHSSVGQYSAKYGTIISNPGDLQVGDLVFFANTYKRGISHVGIYIGGGNVVQALSPKLGVGVANLSGGYWASRYYGAIRPSR